MEIRDALSSELVSAIAKPDDRRDCGLAYSPDGHFLACISDNLTIWDIQTGGAAKEIECHASCNSSIVWSLDGKTVGMTEDSTVRLYDVVSGTIRSPGTLQSGDKLRLWAHDRSFRIMTTGLEGRVFTIEVFEVGPGLTKVESFRIEHWEQGAGIESFSPATYRVSILVCGRVRILNVRNAECLLEEGSHFVLHCFSSDGSLFAAALPANSIRIWKHNSGRYTPWKALPFENWISSFGNSPLQFSPTSSSILGLVQGVLQVFHLDGPPIVAPDNDVSLAVLSPCGTYMATAGKLGHTIAITNLLSQTAPQFIDTSMEIRVFFFTGKVLIVLGLKVLTAWRLTDEGLVDGVSGNRRAGDNDSAWAISVSGHLTFVVEDQNVIIFDDQNIAQVYDARTGEVAEPASTSPHSHTHRYSGWAMSVGEHYPHYHCLAKQKVQSGDIWPVSEAISLEGWVKDREGKYRFCIPMEWGSQHPHAGWLSNITTLWLDFSHAAVIIMF